MLGRVASSSFENDLERIEILAATPVMSTALLERNLNCIYEQAAAARFDDYDVISIVKAAPSLMYRLFDVRVGLREKLAHYEMLGLMTPGVFANGDTVTNGRKVQFDPIPHFSPERFASVRTPSPAKRKSLQKGLDQLREEGAIQVMWSPNSTDPMRISPGVRARDRRRCM